MARYGLDFYGYPKYGSATLPVFRAEPFARCIDYGSILIDWTSPPGAWTDLRLVRNSSGPPISVQDGVTVVDAYRPNNSFVDAGLVGGREYHYTVFVYAATVGRWVNAGSTSTRCARNYGYTDALWQRLPGMYKLDSFAELTASQVETSTLRRFLTVFGFQLDIMRTDLDALMKISAGDQVPYAALPAMLRQLGFDPEPELSSRVSRQLASNSLPLYQSKGSALCLENLANIVGWDADIRLGHNKLLDDMDTMTALGVGRWKTDYENTTVQARPNGVAMATFRGEGYITLDPTGEGYAAVSKKGKTGRLHTVPVVQGRRYMASVYVRGSNTAQIAIDWYSAGGGLISFTEGTATPAAPDAWSTRLICDGIAPPGTRFAGIRVVAQDGPEIHFNAAQFEESATSNLPADWQPARQVFFVLRADAINEIRNPGGQTGNTAFWTGAGLYAANDPDPDIRARRRADGFLFRWSGPNQTDAQDQRAVVANPIINVVPGQQWTFLAEVRPATTYDFSEDVPPEEITVNLDIAAYLNLYSGDVALEPFHLSPADFIHIEATTDYDNPDNALRIAAGLPPFSGFEDDWNRIRLTYTVPDDGSVTAIQPGFMLRRIGVTTVGPLTSTPPVVAPSVVQLGGEGYLSLTGVVPMSVDDLGAVRIRHVALVNKPDEVAFYFDGSTPTETADFMWEGQPHASRSHFYERRTIKAQRLRALAPRFLPAGRAFTLLFAQPEASLLGSDNAVQNYDVNPEGPPDLTVSTELDIRWRRLPSWNDLVANRATWNDVVSNNPTWLDVQDGS